MNKIGLLFFMIISATNVFGSNFRELRSAWDQNEDFNDDLEQKPFLTQKRIIIGTSALIIAAAAAYAHKMGLSTALYCKMASFFKDTNVELIAQREKVFDRCLGKLDETGFSNEQLAKSLEQLGPDVVDEKGKSPLHYAVNSGNTALAAYLIDVCRINPEKFPDLFEYAFTDAMKEFLIARNVSQVSALQKASKEGSVGKTLTLLRTGANPSDAVEGCSFKMYPILQGARFVTWVGKNVGILRKNVGI